MLNRNTLERALVRINESTRPAGAPPAPVELRRAALIDALRILEPDTSPSTETNIEALEAQLDVLLNSLRADSPFTAHSRRDG